jgi:hypothetical protein
MSRRCTVMYRYPPEIGKGGGSSEVAGYCRTEATPVVGSGRRSSLDSCVALLYVPTRKR